MDLFRAIVVVALIVALYVYDVFLTVMVRAYFSTFIKRIESILK